MAILPLMMDLTRVVRAMLGRDWFPQLDLQSRTERFGSDYGGWDVAVEGIGSGAVVYSFGIGEDLSFDLALIERFAVTVHGFDPTPRSQRWVAQQRLPARFMMHDYGLADRDGLLPFYPPDNPAHISHTILDHASARSGAIRVPMQRLDSIMRELGHDHVDLLKLDIEGAEYAVFEDLERSSIRPGQILVEFHHRFRGVGIGETKAAVAALRRMGYGLFAVSRAGTEYGFVRPRTDASLASDSPA
jgi:FkbM family methyltransferase